jgi:hypothetical protein
MISYRAGTPKPVYKPIVKASPITQEELDKLVAECTLKIGDVIAYERVADNPISAGTCDIVIDIEKDVTKIDYDYQSGAPRFLLLMGCYVGSPLKEDEIPFHRLGSGQDYKKIPGYYYEN